MIRQLHGQSTILSIDEAEDRTYTKQVPRYLIKYMFLVISPQTATRTTGYQPTNLFELFLKEFLMNDFHHFTSKCWWKNLYILSESKLYPEKTAKGTFYLQNRLTKNDITVI